MAKVSEKAIAAATAKMQARALLDECVGDFRVYPSAARWNYLASAMLAYQQAVQNLDDVREREFAAAQRQG
jgi:hypothetical protein